MMSDDSGRSDTKRRLPTDLNEVDKRIKSRSGPYRRVRTRSSEREPEYRDTDDNPSTSSSASRMRYPFHVSTGGSSSESEEAARYRPRRISPRQAPYPDRMVPGQDGPSPGPAQPLGLPSDRPGSPANLTLSSGQPLVNPPLKTQAAFVGKLYSMLEDEEIHASGLLHWSNHGTTFICPNPTEFSKAILPRFFKHNNWQSFVRQLNMYSFNKVNELYATTNDTTAWEFRHPLFRQGEPHLLASIKRKATRNQAPDGNPMISPTEEYGEIRMLGHPQSNSYLQRHYPSQVGYGPGPSSAGVDREPAAWPSDAAYPPSAPAHLQHHQLPRQSAPHPPISPLAPPVYGLDLKTGKTIEARPYEMTARASTRGYFDSARPTSAGHGRSATHPSDQHTSTGNQAAERLPAPSNASMRGSREMGQDQAVSGGLVQLHPQAQHVSSPMHPYQREEISQVAYLQDKVARLQDALMEQKLDALRREIEAVNYSVGIMTWLPGASVNDRQHVHQALEQRVLELRREYEVTTHSATEARRWDNQVSTAPSSTTRTSHATEAPTVRSSTTSGPITPVTHHNLLPSRASHPNPGTSSSLSMSEAGVLAPRSSNPSPASSFRQLPPPVRHPSLHLGLSGLPTFPGFARDSLTSPLAHEYLPKSAGSPAGQKRPEGGREQPSVLGESPGRHEIGEGLAAGTSWREPSRQRELDVVPTNSQSPVSPKDTSRLEKFEGPAPDTDRLRSVRRQDSPSSYSTGTAPAPTPTRSQITEASSRPPILIQRPSDSPNRSTASNGSNGSNGCHELKRGKVKSRGSMSSNGSSVSSSGKAAVISPKSDMRHSAPITEEEESSNGGAKTSSGIRNLLN